jgi:hypothetical protein
MLANLQRTLGLWFRAQTGLTAAVFIFGCIAAVAALMGFIFLCVSGYAWAVAELGPVFGGLTTASTFLAIAACCFAAATSSRRQAQHRAAIERATRSQGASLLANPRMLQIAMHASRAIGWQRAIPIALIAFLATEWVRNRRRGGTFYESERSPAQRDFTTSSRLSSVVRNIAAKTTLHRRSHDRAYSRR